MKSKKTTTNKLSLSLNILLVLFIIVYFLVPFSVTGIWATVFSPLCQITKVFQGEDYMPGWCLVRDEMIIVDNGQQLNNVNSNININSNINTNLNSNTNVNTNLNTNVNVGLANPAAVKCAEDGGTSEPYATAGGEAALCVFEDKSICEEWAYFRGECTPGNCFKECKSSGTRSEGWYNSCTGELIRYEDCATDPVVQPNIEKDITVTSPVDDEQLSSPFQVEGRAKAENNMVYVRVKSISGATLINVEGSVKNVGNDGFGDFSIKINYEFSNTKEGFVEIFSKQGENEVDLVAIPVKF